MECRLLVKGLLRPPKLAGTFYRLKLTPFTLFYLPFPLVLHNSVSWTHGHAYRRVSKTVATSGSAGKDKEIWTLFENS